MRLELLGFAFTAQHSDARVLEHLIYKYTYFHTHTHTQIVNAFTSIFSLHFFLSFFRFSLSHTHNLSPHFSSFTSCVHWD
jgi:hypothetical protein